MNSTDSVPAVHSSTEPFQVHESLRNSPPLLYRMSEVLRNCVAPGILPDRLDGSEKSEFLDLIAEYWHETEDKLEPLVKHAFRPNLEANSQITPQQIYEWLALLSQRLLLSSPNNPSFKCLLQQLQARFPGAAIDRNDIENTLSGRYVSEAFFYSRHMAGRVRASDGKKHIFLYRYDVELARYWWLIIVARVEWDFLTRVALFKPIRDKLQCNDNENSLFTRLKNQVCVTHDQLITSYDRMEFGDLSFDLVAQVPRRFYDARPPDEKRHPDPALEFVEFFRDYLHRNQFRKRGSNYYCPIYTTVDGRRHYTHAWRQMGTIEQLVFKVASPQTNQYQFNNFIAKGNGIHLGEKTAKLFAILDDEYFPDFRPQRNVFAFKNGLYDCSNDQFYQFGRESIPNDLIAIHFIPFDFSPEDSLTSKRRQIENDLRSQGASQRQINEALLEFYSGEDLTWEDIPTEIVSQVFKMQIPATDFKEVERWWYVMNGRLLYEVGKHDDWQTFPMLIGVSGSGKSTAGSLMPMYAYPKHEVGVISASGTQTIFGLSSIYEKTIFACYEYTNKFGISHTDLQSMASGENVVITPKNKTSFDIPWTAPGIFMGNGFGVEATAMERRSVIWWFPNKIQNAQAFLSRQMKENIPRFIAKCNRAYLWAVRKYGTDTLYNEKVLPRYFHHTRNMMRASFNQVFEWMMHSADFQANFLCSAETRENAVRASLLEEAYNNWLRRVHSRKPNRTDIGSQDALEVFAEAGVTKKYEKRKLNGNPCGPRDPAAGCVSDTWYIGIKDCTSERSQ